MTCLKRVNRPVKSKQFGFVVLMSLLLLVVGASIWFVTSGNIRSETIKLSNQSKHISDLQKIKERMLTYAVLQPELFATGFILGSTFIPGPGYFPCPDTSNDAAGEMDASCGNDVTNNVVVGMIPNKDTARFFTFNSNPREQARYWMALDPRYAVVNTAYNNVGGSGFAVQRYAPLNSNDPSLASLTLDGVGDYVMVLMYSGEPLAGQNQANTGGTVDNFLELENSNGNTNFISVGPNRRLFNDYVIGITREEWRAVMLSRVTDDINQDDVPDLCVSLNEPTLGVVDTPHWFEACNSLTPVGANCPTELAFDDNNPLGQNWRAVLGCP